MSSTKPPALEIESYAFRVVVEPDPFDDGTPAYHAYIPALPGCRSWGHTIEEALANLEETARLWLGLMKERGEPIPQEIHVEKGPRIVVNLPRE